MTSDQKITKLESLLKLVDESLTREEFIQSFEKVVVLVKELQVKNMEEFQAMWDMIGKVKTKMMKDTSANAQDMKDMCQKMMDSMMAEHDKKMTEVDAKMDSVEDGQDADEEKIVQDVLAQIKLPEYKQTVLDTPEQLRDKLETLDGDQRLDKSAIKGLEEEIKKLNESITQARSSRVIAGPSANSVQFADLSSQCNGSNKSFNVPRHRVALLLTGTQAPLIYKPTTDFTTANVTLTLTSTVAAPDSGQTLIFLYVK